MFGLVVRRERRGVGQEERLPTLSGWESRLEIRPTTLAQKWPNGLPGFWMAEVKAGLTRGRVDFGSSGSRVLGQPGDVGP